MGRPKKTSEPKQAPEPNTPQENLMDHMLKGSLERYEKTMKDFIQRLDRLLTILEARPFVQEVIPVQGPSVPAYSPPMTISIPQIIGDAPPPLAGNLSDKQIWYMTVGPGGNIPPDFIRRAFGKGDWHSLTKEVVGKLIGMWKDVGEKTP